MQAVFDGWLQCLIFLVGDGGSQKKGLSRNERDQIFPITQQQFLDLCPRTGTDSCGVAWGEINMWTVRKTLGFPENSLGV